MIQKILRFFGFYKNKTLGSSHIEPTVPWPREAKPYDRFYIKDEQIYTNRHGFKFAFDEESKYLACNKVRPDGTSICYDIGSYDADRVSDAHPLSDNVWLIILYTEPRFSCELCREWVYGGRMVHGDCETKDKLARE